jgi:hypothetical protein
MELEDIIEVNLKRKNAIQFLLNNPGLPSNVIDLCLVYIDALADEKDLIIAALECNYLKNLSLVDLSV